VLKGIKEARVINLQMQGQSAEYANAAPPGAAAAQKITRSSFCQARKKS
jgi:hypothetical protein